MIKKSTIRKTAVCWWSDEDSCYVVESPLFNPCVVDGASEDEAFANYEDALELMYESLFHNKVAGRNSKGRPVKNGVKTFIELRQQSKDAITRLSKQLGISQGEVVDWAVFALEKSSLKIQLKTKTDRLSSVDMAERLSHLEERFQVMEAKQAAYKVAAKTDSKPKTKVSKSNRGRSVS
jgi:predicted RNase H-like HicB family nuclease